ncbi:HAD family hydrolase [Parenemella sanctibonifatiensis]|uniref:Haloacid dehalogenase n=1 Tax=Parenemella sanctibonifatiensis TaxID=2016505 RepID=A0A255DZH7_9ACTN|nr:HAD-IA family hydrolase [Parenemella sanctibonifatiensis]OYN84684.1 haloacid dehalogenase [Parenemella sanctibonifatiensis]
MTTAPGAVLFDLDGVLTPTAEVHRKAWAALFSPFFEERGLAAYTDDDYFDHIDGLPRFDGVRGMLAARGVELPEGEVDDPAGEETVCGLGNRKNELFTQVLVSEGVKPYPGSVRLLDRLWMAGTPIAVVSSSRNAEAVLTAAGLRQRFGVVVDGSVAAREGLAGKPAPDTFRYAAELLEVAEADAVVVEDAVSGVQAGAAGSFAQVIGVDRGAGADTLREAGATSVVSDLGDLVAAWFGEASFEPPAPQEGSEDQR